ncbi:hypothetical protein EPH95_02805 [Salicibibacter halophilus]|uniref:Uncharacterized protein n=1 Tax=Salicibibacter halophilus TaxID=2502791 RepID=A0A514LEF4_9BACI|nr:hypothetical protein [Salicibibacter halophilus]QDI90232.1 hypothetical protein EPH95_02805 [Salicibibacter halophilus]
MGWIILLWVAAIAIIGACIFGFVNWKNKGQTVGERFRNGNKKTAKNYVLLGVAAVVLIGGIVATIPLTNTESFQRTLSSIQSEFDGGIEREITVYSEGGEEIFSTEGSFDIEHSNDRLRWVDEQGNVQIVYLGRSATAVVSEKGEEE